MTIKLLRLITVFSCLVFFVPASKAQNCIPTNIGGAVFNLNCNQVCSTLVFKIPHIKGTDDYTVNSIPYAALPYTSGTTINSIYVDDKFSALIPMGFSFVFTDSITAIW